MPTSGPGSSGSGGFAPRGLAALERGLSLLELLVVLAIVAISVGAVSLALRDSTAATLEREAVRLAALLEMARAESRATGSPVRWLPAGIDSPVAAETPRNEVPPDFRFVGLSGLQTLPMRWLDPRIRAQVAGSPAVVLGPDAILPVQRVVLSLEGQQLAVASDGLGPFAIGDNAPPPSR